MIFTKLVSSKILFWTSRSLFS